jgi:nucleotide-binding universal stress UspA family protein
MTKSLIAIDGSKPSKSAMEYVVRRKRRGEHLKALILNVQRAISPNVGFIDRAIIRDYQAEESDKVLNPEIRRMRQNLKAEAYMEIGEAAASIVAFARKKKCQEIVIGSRGLGGVKGLFLGSTANKVIQLSSIPVIVVK